MYQIRLLKIKANYIRNVCCRQAVLWAVSVFCFSGQLYAQSGWQRVPLPEVATDPALQKGRYALYQADLAAIQAQLLRAPQEQSGVKSDVVLSIPDPDGRMTDFRMSETFLLEHVQGTDTRNIHTYTGQAGDRGTSLHLTLSPGKMYGIVTGPKGTWFVSTREAGQGGAGEPVIAVFDEEGRPGRKTAVPCSLNDGQGAGPDLRPRNAGFRTTGVPSAVVNLKIYRLAMATTGEYTNANGSQSATVANLTALLNNLNALFERDFGIRFVLVTNNNLLYTDPATDPFDASLGTCGSLTASQNSFNAQLSSTLYDAGITIFYDNFGGCASVGAACTGNKNRAVSGYDSIDPTSYLLEVTSHELGHMYDAGHSHNSNALNCSFTASSAWEPGGGSTIMAYTNCTPSFASGNTGLYFHGGNVAQVLAYSNSVQGSCYTTGAVNNSPAITTPTNDTFFIPVSTPYRLYATASDPDGDDLLYTFEQMDLGTGSTLLPSDTTSFGPVVRSRQPSLTSFRYIPNMDSLLSGMSHAFESLPSISRVLTFWATVRDNRPGGGTISRDTILVRTTGTAPFTVTSQSTPATLSSGSPLTVTWNVAGTTAAPFNTSTVRILFAADGHNYNHVLAAGVPNNGSASVTVPNISTTEGRIMVAAATGENIFFNINGAPLTIASPCPEVQYSTIWPQDAVTAQQGSTALALALHPTFGPGTDTLSGEITAASPVGNIAFKTSISDTTGCYNGSGFGGRYNVFHFQVGATGSYNISRTLYTLTGNLFMSLYSSQGVTATTAASCNNYLHRSNVWQTPTGASLTSSFQAPMQGDSIYYLPALKTGTTTLGTYRIDVEGPGKIYTQFRDPASGYSYLVVNAGDTIISATATPPDLQAQGPGSYRVYGLSHSTAFVPGSLTGTLFSTFLNAGQSAPACASVSSNAVPVTIESLTPLPVHYLDLAAYATKSGVQLDWKIFPGDEAGIKGFTVEHSADGKQFGRLADFSPEQGTAAGRYSYVHTRPLAGRNFYRVKQVALNNAVAYSPVREVTFRNHTGIEIVPNPVKGLVTLRLDRLEQPLAITLSDMAGRSILTFTMDAPEYGLDLSTLAPGVYLLSSSQFVEKVVKQ